MPVSPAWWPSRGCLDTLKERRDERMGRTTWNILWAGWRALVGNNHFYQPEKLLSSYAAGKGICNTGCPWSAEGSRTFSWSTDQNIAAYKLACPQVSCQLVFIDGILLWYFLLHTQSDNPISQTNPSQTWIFFPADVKHHTSSPATGVFTAKGLRILTCTAPSGWRAAHNLNTLILCCVEQQIAPDFFKWHIWLRKWDKHNQQIVMFLPHFFIHLNNCK